MPNTNFFFASAGGFYGIPEKSSIHGIVPAANSAPITASIVRTLPGLPDEIILTVVTTSTDPILFTSPIFFTEGAIQAVSSDVNFASKANQIQYKLGVSGPCTVLGVSNLPLVSA